MSLNQPFRTNHLQVEGFPAFSAQINDIGDTVTIQNPGRSAIERLEFTKKIQDLFSVKSHTTQSGSLYKFFSGIKRMKVTIPVMHPEGHCFNVRYTA